MDDAHDDALLLCPISCGGVLHSRQISSIPKLRDSSNCASAGLTLNSVPAIGFSARGSVIHLP